ncbi:MAG: hypothetical protein PHT84_04860 [Candidatus Pacebacteria bacterium]|nr:hypothetical protein [Candidatus Paceibacterota bacterium]
MDENTKNWLEEDYAGVYSRVETFAPKELHDNEIADLVADSLERAGLDKEESLIAEVGAGRAPISRRLIEKGYECKAFDLNPDMTPSDNHLAYDKNFDLTSTELPQGELGKYDVVVLENVWYATTLPSEGTRNYTFEEAKVMRLISLKKAASLLRPGGMLVLSDPLKRTKDFGPKRVLDFLNFDQDARLSLRNEKRSIGKIMIEYMKDSKIKEVLKKNKEIMNKVVLLNKDEIMDLVVNTGMFDDVVYSKTESYLGSNLLMVLRRNGLEIGTSGQASLGEPIALRGFVHKDILKKVGKFRREIYAKSNTTDNLPEIDKFDLKEGVLVVYPNKYKLGFAAVATLQAAGDMGLDAEELMEPEEGDFYQVLNAKIAEKSPVMKQALLSRRDINYAEIRRLAADNLGRADARKFLNSLCEIFKQYAEENNIDIVLFMSDDKRFRMFNLSNSEVQFKKIEGFHLDRKDEMFQTMMISAANYFFKDWANYLDEKEIVLVNTLRQLVVNGDTWIDIIENHPLRSDIEAAVRKLLQLVPDNVSIYYTDYSMKG